MYIFVCIYTCMLTYEPTAAPTLCQTGADLAWEAELSYCPVPMFHRKKRSSPLATTRSSSSAKSRTPKPPLFHPTATSSCLEAPTALSRCHSSTYPACVCASVWHVRIREHMWYLLDHTTRLGKQRNRGGCPAHLYILSRRLKHSIRGI